MDPKIVDVHHYGTLVRFNLKTTPEHLIPALILPHGASECPFSNETNSFCLFDLFDEISRILKTERRNFPRRAPQTAGHRWDFGIGSIGPYEALYRALFWVLFGCPIFPLWAALFSTFFVLGPIFHCGLTSNHLTSSDVASTPGYTLRLQAVGSNGLPK